MFKRLASKLGRGPKSTTRLSIIVVAYKMDAQIGNTLRSLLPPVQKKIRKADYEIIVVDNGTPEPLPEATWKIASNVRYLRFEPGEASPNPGVAINRAVRTAAGEAVCVMIDGARMVTPGVVSWGLRFVEMAPRTMVEVRGWHLGTKVQSKSILEGYTHEVEAAMLEEAQWWENGYRLFNISVSNTLTPDGFGGKAMESNCIFLSRALFDEIGGFNDAFKEPGGGLVNLDFYARAVAASDRVFTLLGEGTFHQTHGGASTGLAPAELEAALARWWDESRTIRGPADELKAPSREKFILAGQLPPESRRWLPTENSG